MVDCAGGVFLDLAVFHGVGGRIVRLWTEGGNGMRRSALRKREGRRQSVGSAHDARARRFLCLALSGLPWLAPCTRLTCRYTVLWALLYSLPTCNTHAKHFL